MSDRTYGVDHDPGPGNDEYVTSDQTSEYVPQPVYPRPQEPMTWGDFKDFVVIFLKSVPVVIGFTAWTCGYVFLIYKICGWLYVAGEKLYHG